MPRSRSRFRILVQLVLLVGLPLAVLVGLFGFGVYLGLEYREPVLTFERDVLRLDVAAVTDSVAPTSTTTPMTRPAAGSSALPSNAGDERAGAEVAGTPGAGSSPRGSNEATTPAMPVPDGGATPLAPAGSTPAAASPPIVAEPGVATPPSPGGRPVDPAVTLGEGVTPPAVPPAATDSVSMGLPVRVTVKVLVDRELIATEADWIAYVQRLVSRASAVYEHNFGIELALYGVSTWDVATRGVRAEALLEDVRARPREGAQLLIGLTSRPYDADIAGQGDLPGADSPINGAYAVVYAARHHDVPHLMTMLHEIGHIFGALDIPEGHAETARASFMNARLVGETTSPWIDPDNRRRIIARKALPFAPSPVEP